jgi:hypothetical protein
MPPMIRKVPYWYQRYHDTVISAFEDAVRSSTIQSVYVIPAMQGLTYSRDCIHLSDKSGPE